MRVVILGGYGVFGGRLARLLMRDGHRVWIAGRNLRQAERFVRRHGGHPLHVDLKSNLAAVLPADPEILVDAAGPYQAYGDSPNSVAAFCVKHGINYVDLCDDADFTERVGDLDQAARDAGCYVLSGASSVPGLSSSVVVKLGESLEQIDLIETAILPGNRAPLGRSVVASIVRRLGKTFPLWRSGQWQAAACWSEPRRYQISGRLRRRAWLIDVPDNRVFPALFGARAVVFRAGLELPLLNFWISALARLRRTRIVLPTSATAAFCHRVAALLKPFGSDEGGMVVVVVGRRRRASVVRRWELMATKGDGPFVPVSLIRALLRRSDAIRPGARPCLAEVPLVDIEDAMSDLNIQTAMSEMPAVPLIKAALAERWQALPESVRRVHSIHDRETFSGRAEVTRGSGLLPWLAAHFFRFPCAGSDVSLTLTKTRTDSGETWERNFAGKVFRSYLTPAGKHHYRERFWAFTYEQELPVDGDGLHFPVRRGWFLGVPLPKFLLPRSDSREFDVNGKFHFDVQLKAPLTGTLIVRYRGTVAPSAPS